MNSCCGPVSSEVPYSCTSFSANDLDCISHHILKKCYPGLGWRLILPPPACQYTHPTLAGTQCTLFFFCCSLYPCISLHSFILSLNGSSCVWCLLCVLMTFLLTTALLPPLSLPLVLPAGLKPQECPRKSGRPLHNQPTLCGHLKWGYTVIV